MASPRGDSEQTKAAILEAARELFAERGVKVVRVRDIAQEAGVTHALVHRYFGSKEDIVREILKREVQHATARAGAPAADTFESLQSLREMLRFGFMDMATTIRLITRAELSDLHPEDMLQGEGRLLGKMREWVEMEQKKSGKAPEDLPDPAIASAVIGAAVFSFVNLSPWLMTAVGLSPEDYEARLDEIIEVLVCMSEYAIGRDIKS